MAGFGPLVSPEWLAEHLGDPGLRVIDVRWYLAGRSGREAYQGGHLPGAVFVDLEEEITGHAGGPGRHPLPAPDQFQEAMRRAGVDDGSRVVAYGDDGAYSSARLWWLLTYFGHQDAAVLDGGIAAWVGPLDDRPVTVHRGDFTVRPPRREMVVDRDYVRGARQAVLFDARAPERYRGESEPIDAKAGHIPGARNACWRANLGDDWRFKPVDELRRMYADGEGKEVIAYCGSGVTASVDVLAMKLAGLEKVRLYEGSWSDWSRHDLPVATGEEPHA